MENITIDLTPILQLAVMLLSAIVTAFVVPWIKAKASTQQMEALERATKTAVFAAEQVYGSGWGRAKLHYAEEYLKKKGYTVDADLIEATVKQYFGHIDFELEEDEEEDAPEEGEDPQQDLQ